LRLFVLIGADFSLILSEKGISYMPKDDDKRSFALNDAITIVRQSITNITTLSLDGNPDTTKLKAVRITDADTLDRLKDRIFAATKDFLSETLNADVYFEFQDYATSDSIRAAANATLAGVAAARASKVNS
jgi:hypothetical protein